MAKGRVYWLTGLSNSGKTTIGTILYYELKKTADNVVILDGDILKDVTKGLPEKDYTKEGRIIRAKRYSTLCKLLSDQGITVVICTISMLHEIRDWNRRNIMGYIEVFIDAPKEVLIKRDKKGVYCLEPWMEFPKDPDIRLVNDGTISVKALVETIKAYKPANEDDFDRDKQYWNQYYSESRVDLSAPSPFAVAISQYLAPGKHLLELGCGNGRDSLYFLQKGLRVTAVDVSDRAVNALNKQTMENDDALFICDDFVKCQSLFQIQFDYIYSRFTLHAINEMQENELLKNIKSGLSCGGMLFVEARTTHDELFGKGKQVGRNAFIYNEHYRRFIVVDEFLQKLRQHGFEILSIEEKNGLSKTNDSDPVLMRCIARLDAKA